jgi:TetR/AcrR family transcriptional repressor of nem operon
MNGKTKPRELAKQETREALIRAGMAAFSEDGVDLPSLDGICARAGFTRGAFYVHFKDRDDFFAAVADQALQDFVNWVISTGESQGGLQGVVERFLRVVTETKHGLGAPQRLFMQIAARGMQHGASESAPHAALIRGAIDRMSAVAEQGQAQGQVKRDLDPSQLGLLLVASAVGFIVLSGGGLESDIEQVRTLCARWLFESNRPAISSADPKPTP